MYRHIKHQTHPRKTSGIKYIDMPINNSIPCNSITSFLNEDQWKKLTTLKILKGVSFPTIALTSHRIKTPYSPSTL